VADLPGPPVSPDLAWGVLLTASPAARPWPSLAAALVHRPALILSFLLSMIEAGLDGLLRLVRRIRADLVE
jgi:hypothetical protein